MKIKPKLIYNIAFLSIIFMYFKIIPVNIETQPILVVLLIPLFLLVNNNMILTIKSEEKYLFIYLFIILFYFFISLFTNQIDSFLYFLKFILGPISYIFLLKNVELLEVKTLKIMTLILFFVSFIYLTHFPFLYNLLNSVLSLFINRYAINYIGARGMSILTPEPSYFVYFAMLLLFSFDFVEYKSELREHVFYRILIYFMCILTKSALVYMFILFYVLFKYIYLNKKISINHTLKNIFIFFSVIILIIICSEILNINLVNNRFNQIIKSLDFDNILDLFFYSDESSGFRFLMNSIYLLSIFIKPFGYGFGGMEKQWSNVAKIFNIQYTRNGSFLYTYNDSSLLHAQAYIPNVIGTIGIFSVFLIIFIYSNNRLSDVKLKKILMIFLTLFLWFLQSNMFNPVFWILIGFCKYSGEKKGKIS